MSVFSSLPVLCALFAGICFSVLGLSYKVADNHRCRPLVFVAVFTLTAGTLSLIKSFSEVTTWGDSRLWVLGLAGGLSLFFAIVFLVRANALGPASLTWTITNLSLLLPIVFAAVMFHERLYWVDLGSIALFSLMLWAFGRGVAGTGEVHAGNQFMFTLMLAGVFIANGIWLICTRLTEQMFHGQNSAGFPIIAFFSAACYAILAYLLREGRQPWHAAEWKVGIFGGAASGIGTMFFLGAMTLPAIIVFPVGQGISLLGGVALTTIIYKERFTAMKFLGVILGLLVLLLSVLREPLDRALQHVGMH